MKCPSIPLMGLLLLPTSPSSVGLAVAAGGAKSPSREVQFRDDDVRAQRIAKTLLAKEVAAQEGAPIASQSWRTAWVRLSKGDEPTLFVMYGCSPTGNCGLYSFERSKSSWRQILNSDAQRVSLLASSHHGRRDISAYMHGSATSGTAHIYWWRGSRYVQVSERKVGR